MFQAIIIEKWETFREAIWDFLGKLFHFPPWAKKVTFFKINIITGTYDDSEGLV
jgi:hypothetical protein